MGFSVVSNVASANAQANMEMTQVGLNRALNRLASGYRINYSGDDSAGLAVANSYRNTIAILNQGIRNANDGLSVLQIKDGALANMSTLLDRMATLATQASSASNGVDITKLSDEFNELTSEIDREAGVAGLDSQAGFSVFVSSESTASNGKLSGTIGAATTSDLGITQLTFTSVAQAQTALSQVKAAVSTLGSVQNTIGTLENRISFRHQPLAVAGGQHQGCRRPHPRREHRGGIGEHDAVQHPDAERHRRLGAGKPVDVGGPGVAAVIARRDGRAGLTAGLARDTRARALEFGQGGGAILARGPAWLIRSPSAASIRSTSITSSTPSWRRSGSRSTRSKPARPHYKRRIRPLARWPAS
jgi:flagellin